ncbi:hypothetical protein ABBQ38_000975 [Trebouxia sp. C0009 RCD-2024]
MAKWAHSLLVLVLAAPVQAVRSIWKSTSAMSRLCLLVPFFVYSWPCQTVNGSTSNSAVQADPTHTRRILAPCFHILWQGTWFAAKS